MSDGGGMTGGTGADVRLEDATVMAEEPSFGKVFQSVVVGKGNVAIRTFRSEAAVAAGDRG